MTSFFVRNLRLNYKLGECRGNSNSCVVITSLQIPYASTSWAFCSTFRKGNRLKIAQEFRFQEFQNLKKHPVYWEYEVIVISK